MPKQTSKRRHVPRVCYREPKEDSDETEEILKLHLGEEESCSDFEQEYKQDYVRLTGAFPGSKRDKRHRKKTIEDIMEDETSSSDNEDSESISKDNQDKSPTDHSLHTNDKNCKKFSNNMSVAKLPMHRKRLVSDSKKNRLQTKIDRSNRSIGRKSVLHRLQSSVQLGNEGLNLSESSSEEEGCSSNGLLKKVCTKKPSDPANHLAKMQKIYKNSGKQSLNIRNNRSVNLNLPEDLDMASQLESLATSYNQFSNITECSKGNYQGILSNERTNREKNADIQSLLSLGEGIDVEHTAGIKNNDRSSSGDESNRPVEITLENTEYVKGTTKKKIFDPEAHANREFHRIKREIQLLLHKASFTCLVAHIRFINSYLGAPGSIGEQHSKLLLAIGLSIIPVAHATHPEKLTIVRLGTFVSWFRDAFPVVNGGTSNYLKDGKHNVDGKLFDESPEIVLQKALENYICWRKEHLVFIFVLATRALGWNTRLIYNLETIPIKPEKTKSTDQTQCKSTTVHDKNIFDTKKHQKDHKMSKCISIPQVDGANDNNEKTCSRKRSYNNKSQETCSSKENTNTNKGLSLPDEAYKTKCRSVAAAVKQIRQNRKLKRKSTENEIEEHKSNKSIRSPNRTAILKKNVKTKEDIKLSQEGLDEAAIRSINVKTKYNKYVKQFGSDSDTDDSSERSEKKSIMKHIPETPRQRSKRSVNNYAKQANTSKKATISTWKKPCQYWAEVYIAPKWVTVDIVNGRIDCPSALEKYLCGTTKNGKGKVISKNKSRHILYAIAGNIDGSLKDTTKRYTSETYTTSTRRFRLPVEDYIQQTLHIFKASTGSNQSKIESNENECLEKALAAAPMPKNFGAFKNHPFYALKRDLLKNEAIYPSNAPTLGFIQGHGIYARECVQVLFSRTAWLKEGLVVRMKEEAYKIVTAKARIDKMSGEKLSDEPQELFGKWQTEKYIPPAAKNGKVPRNEYGNVELFKPWMLPKGTIHIPIQGVNRVAKKLNIDCAPAMVGWEFTNGFMRPVYDGYVVCEEVNEFIMDAWNQEMDEQMKKDALKKEKRVLDNWTKLVRGVLLYRKIANKYSKNK